MKRTAKYQMGYFEEGDITLSSIEMQRWETLDAQLFALYDIIGNGIIDGWDIIPSSGLSIVITPGSGNVNFVSVKTTDNTSLSGLTPNTRNYIYAGLAEDSYWEQTTVFSSFVSEDDSEKALYLGYVDTNATDVTTINTDGRAFIGFISLVRTLISDHRHIGGTENPPPVDLASEVQGVIKQGNLPDLDASIIQTGKLNQDRIPALDHITQLINQGTLTHSQLDSFVEALSITNPTLMGETSTIDLLQLILALKHVYPDIDDYLVNEVAYIPGISPDSYVDWENTTADVDTRTYSEGGQHTITGSAVYGKNAYTYAWDSETEFKSGTNSDVFIDGSSVCLESQETTLQIDDFNDLSKWEVITNDLSSLTIALEQDSSTFIEPSSSGKLVIGNQTVEIALVIQSAFDAQDWSKYNKITFFLKTESVQHGDVFFFLRDNIAGTQNSHTKVISRNKPTVNVDTLQNGWQEVTVDISSYTRSQINKIAFYISSQDGWDTAKGFDLNIDDIYLTTGNQYKEDGYVRLIFGSDFLYDFWRVRWNASIPTDSQSTGVELKYRTRVANTEGALAIAGWSAYSSVSGSDISLPAPNLYKYIEIEMYFGASDDFTRTACLKKLFLDFYASDVENSFNYDDQDSWQSGDVFNIDTTTNPGSIQISETDDINNISIGSEAEVVQLDDNLVELYNITGSSLPRSTYQILNETPPSIGLITGVSRGNNGNLWICDTDNDRVLELDKYGFLVRGFYGSYLVENTKESEVKKETETETETEDPSLLPSNLLQVLYNSDKGFLYLIFDRDLLDTEISNITNGQLRSGSNIVYLDNYPLSKPLNGFDNVLRLVITGAGKTALDQVIINKSPYLSMTNPYSGQEILSSTIQCDFIVNNFDIGQDGNIIRVTLDNIITQNISTLRATFNNLSEGIHVVKPQLIDGDGSLNTNDEAITEGYFVINSSSTTSPIISITCPKPNQTYSSSPVRIDFVVKNFPILSTGQHIRYVIDRGTPVDYYSTDPIIIYDLERGIHTIRLYLVDSRGNNLSYTNGDITSSFMVGADLNASLKYYYDINNNISNMLVDVASLIFSDVYSPFDVQYILPGDDISNPEDKESILIGKLTNNYVYSKITGI